MILAKLNFPPFTMYSAEFSSVISFDCLPDPTGHIFDSMFMSLCHWKGETLFIIRLQAKIVNHFMATDLHVEDESLRVFTLLIVCCCSNSCLCSVVQLFQSRRTVDVFEANQVKITLETLLPYRIKITLAVCKNSQKIQE